MALKDVVFYIMGPSRMWNKKSHIAYLQKTIDNNCMQIIYKYEGRRKLYEICVSSPCGRGD